MKLLSDATTPFGRKALVAALERSIPLQEVFVPLDGTGPLDQWNPLRQIPVLITDEERAVYDSDVILQYLDTQHREAPIIPEYDRIGTLTRAALANGLIEATLLRRMEVVRPAGEQSPAFIEKLEGRIWRALRALEAELPALRDVTRPLRGDQLTAACAIAYVDFRFSESWRERYPALGAWHANVAERQSMRITGPTRTGPVPIGEFQPK